MYDGRLYPEKLTKYSQKYPGKYRKMGESHWNISRMTKSPIHPIHGLMLSTEDFDKPTRPRPRNMPPIPRCLRSPFPFLEMIWILGRNSQNLLFFAPSFGLLNSQHASKVPDLLQESMTYSWYLLLIIWSFLTNPAGDVAMVMFTSRIPGSRGTSGFLDFETFLYRYLE